MRRLATIPLALLIPSLACVSIQGLQSQMEAYQAQAAVSPTLLSGDTLTLAILPPQVAKEETGGAYIEINYIEGVGDQTPGDVYVDGVEKGGIDWVDDSWRARVEPGSHEVRVMAFMGDEIARTRVWVGQGEVVRLTLSGGVLSYAGRSKAVAQGGLDPEALLTALGREAMATGRFRLVERSKIEKALAEQEFQYSGLVDPSQAVALGRLLGADAVLISAARCQYDHDMEGYLAEINGRIVSVETGEILYIARGRGFGLGASDAAEMAASNFFKRLR